MPIIDNDYFNANMTQLGLKSTFTPNADALTELIDEASDWVEGYLRRHVVPVDLTEVARGRNSHRLLLDHWPVLSITSIDWMDDLGRTGTIDKDDLRILGYGAIEYKNNLTALGSAWDWGWGPRTASNGPFRRDRTYTIAYNAGMDPIPSRIKRATALKVVDLFSPQYQGARDQRSVEFVSKIDEMIVDLLEDFRRERLG